MTLRFSVSGLSRNEEYKRRREYSQGYFMTLSLAESIFCFIFWHCLFLLRHLISRKKALYYQHFIRRIFLDRLSKRQPQVLLILSVHSKFVVIKTINVPGLVI